MSKRGSKNAIKFSGKNWSTGRNRAKKNKNIKSQAEIQFITLCQKFGFDRTKNPLIFAELEAEFKSEFISHKPIKRKEILKKADLYKKHCKKYKIKLNIYEYLMNKLYDKNFYINSEKIIEKVKKNLKTKEKKPKVKFNSEKKKLKLRPILKGGKISDFLTKEVILKLKNLNKK